MEATSFTFVIQHSEIHSCPACISSSLATVLLRGNVITVPITKKKQVIQDRNWRLLLYYWESRQIRSIASIKPNWIMQRLIEIYFKKPTQDSSVISPVHRNGDYSSFLSLFLPILREWHMSLHFEWYEFTNLFEIQHADFEKINCLKLKTFKILTCSFCKIFCFKK